MSATVSYSDLEIQRRGYRKDRLYQLIAAMPGQQFTFYKGTFTKIFSVKPRTLESYLTDLIDENRVLKITGEESPLPYPTYWSREGWERYKEERLEKERRRVKSLGGTLDEHIEIAEADWRPAGRADP